MNAQKALSRFATVEDVMSEDFISLIKVINQITVKYQLPDHSDVNQERYPWSLPFLSTPAFYAARMWEYPFALVSAELQPGMKCADIGCGMTAFSVYLQEVAKCEVVGVDPDVFDAGVRYKGHGVSREFIRRTGLKVVQCGIESISLRSNQFDRVFCLSVIEHLPANIAQQGMQEMARILKPGGRAIVTVDVNMRSDITHPLELIWESGLQPLGAIDLRWPRRRFGIFCDGKQPADVFGMTLAKEDYEVETQYSEAEEDVNLMPASVIPTLRSSNQSVAASACQPPVWRQLVGRAKGFVLSQLNRIRKR